MPEAMTSGLASLALCQCRPLMSQRTKLPGRHSSLRRTALMVIAIASLIGSRALKMSSQIRCTLMTIILLGSVSERRERVTYILEMLKLITVRYNELNRCRRQETHLKASLLRQSVSFKLSRVCFLKTTFIQCRTWKI